MTNKQKIKLIYFKSQGRAELSRLILAQAGVEYEDIRISKEEWPEFKKKIPTGKLPALEYNGEIICQSMAIARFLARKFKLAGKSNWEAAKVDMIVECINEVREEFYKISTDTEKQGTFVGETFSPFILIMETLLSQNAGNYFVGDEVTMADIYLAYTLSSWDEFIGSEWKKNCPNVLFMVHHVNNMHNIKKWIHSRPQADS